MPRSFSKKDERQYEHIKESALDRGRPEKAAERIAGATVNKQRSKEGRTKTAGGSSSSSRKKTPGRGAGRKR